MFLFLLFWGDLLLYVFHGFDVISVPVCSEFISLYRRWDVSNIIKLSFILFYIISRNENRHHWSSILSHSEDLISPWILPEISLSALFCPFCFVCFGFFCFFFAFVCYFCTVVVFFLFFFRFVLFFVFSFVFFSCTIVIFLNPYPLYHRKYFLKLWARLATKMLFRCFIERGSKLLLCQKTLVNCVLSMWLGIKAAVTVPDFYYLIYTH